MHILRVATIPFSVLHHLRSQIDAMLAAGHSVTVVASPDEGAEALARMPGVRFVPVKIERQIRPWADLRALIALYRVLRRESPDVLHTVTPKAGFIGALAGWAARVPVRLHTFTGQAWFDRRGLVRWLSRSADKVILRLDTRCYADSYSQRDFLIADGIAPEGAIHVAGSGSLSGVDLRRFDPDKLRDAAQAVRAGLGLQSGVKVIVFVGRVTRDKGIVELVAAFQQLNGAALILVGPLEPERDPLPEETLAVIRNHSAIHAVGYEVDPERYLAAADVFCLPSYREGFGSVVIEAAALGIPCVGTRIVGLTDAVVDDVTGVLVPPKNVQALADALRELLADDARRRSLGQAARRRVQREFDADAVNARVIEEYRLLQSRQ